MEETSIEWTVSGEALKKTIKSGGKGGKVGGHGGDRVTIENSPSKSYTMDL